MSDTTVSDQQRKLDRCNILLCATGSVASVYLPKILDELKKLPFHVEIKVLVTEKSCSFIDIDTFPVKVYTEADEWKTDWKNRENFYVESVVHVDLRKWADVIVISPLDANTLAKIATGISDNLLTCVLRVWKPESPVLYVPAMNTGMWNHPVTKKNTDILKSWGYCEIPCVEKKLVCGDIGYGAMAAPTTIAQHVLDKLLSLNDVKV